MHRRPPAARRGGGQGGGGGDGGDGDGAGEVHSAAGEYIKSLVFGGLDGILTTFAIVTAAHGGHMDKKAAVLMGVANVVADAFSMGIGDYLSESGEVALVRAEREREAWEFDNFREGEIQEMVELYESKGVSTADAEVILNTMAKYRDFFIDHMMVQELEMMPPDEDAAAENRTNLKKAAVTFTSFMIFGSVPLIAYAIFMNVDWGKDTDLDVTFIIACFVTLLTVFGLGAVKGYISKPGTANACLYVLKSGFTMMLMGCVSAGVSWGLGVAMNAALTGGKVDLTKLAAGGR